MKAGKMNRERRKNLECPCKNCICIPVCRHKEYFELTSCDLLVKYVDDYYMGLDGYDSTHRLDIFKILNPSKWRLTKALNVSTEEFPL